jgi:protein ImuA
MQAEKIIALRAAIERPGLEKPSIRAALGHAGVDLCLNGGLVQGVLHEVFASIGHEAAATGFVAGLAMRVSEAKHVLWIAQDFSTIEFGGVSTIGLLELGFDPQCLLMLCVANAADGLRAAHDALTCAALGAVVLELHGHPKILDLTASRRLTLAAAEKGVTAFLLRLGAQPDVSTAETRWLISAAASARLRDDKWGYPIFKANLVRHRSGPVGYWLVEWNCDDACFQSPA